MSVTISCTIGSRLVNGIKIVVVDTPGFLNTNPNTNLERKNMNREITKCCRMLAPGPHAFLYVINLAERFTREDAKTIKHVDTIFGSQVVDHTIIVFTHNDVFLEYSNTTTEQYLTESSPELRDFLDRCNHRYISVNNNGTQAEKDATVQKLIDMISILINNNNGQGYKSAVSDAITKAMKSS
jgi:GTPase Era involved in 16S rRNA processing